VGLVLFLFREGGEAKWLPLELLVETNANSVAIRVQFVWF